MLKACHHSQQHPQPLSHTAAPPAQTVIECLKMACTGELPPNTRSGQSFIHDPKVRGARAPLARLADRIHLRGGQLVCACAYAKQPLPACSYWAGPVPLSEVLVACFFLLLSRPHRPQCACAGGGRDGGQGADQAALCDAHAPAGGRHTLLPGVLWGRRRCACSSSLGSGQCLSCTPAPPAFLFKQSEASCPPSGCRLLCPACS